MDASIRLTTGDFFNANKQLLETNGIVVFSGGSHSIFASTNPRMYRYLPSNKRKLTTVRMAQSGFVYYCLTKELYWDVLHWWYLCALEQTCIAPYRSVKACTRTGETMKTYNKCHRYDQSALNILLLNKFNFTREPFYNTERIADIRRKSANKIPVKYC